jgi:hypothetical protein
VTELLPDAGETKCTSCDALQAKLQRLQEGLDELLNDARRTRPLLEKYLKLSSAPWMKGMRKGG